MKCIWSDGTFSNFSWIINKEYKWICVTEETNIIENRLKDQKDQATLIYAKYAEVAKRIADREHINLIEYAFGVTPYNYGCDWNLIIFEKDSLEILNVKKQCVFFDKILPGRKRLSMNEVMLYLVVYKNKEVAREALNKLT